MLLLQTFPASLARWCILGIGEQGRIILRHIVSCTMLMNKLNQISSSHLLDLFFLHMYASNFQIFTWTNLFKSSLARSQPKLSCLNFGRFHRSGFPLQSFLGGRRLRAVGILDPTLSGIRALRKSLLSHPLDLNKQTEATALWDLWVNTSIKVGTGPCSSGLQYVAPCYYKNAFFNWYPLLLQNGSTPWHEQETNMSNVICSFLLLVVASLLLVAMPGAPSSVLAPSSKARSP